MKVFSSIEQKAAGLSRLYNFWTQHDTGVISAFRSRKDCGEGDKISYKENTANSSRLKKQLLARGYGVIRIQGSYKENYQTDNEIDVNERSYFVVDLKDTGNLFTDLKKLGEEYEQDTIAFALKKGPYYLVGTNHCDGYPGYGNKVKLGSPKLGKFGEFFSKIKGRSLVFSSSMETLTDYTPTEIRSIKNIDKMLKK